MSDFYADMQFLVFILVGLVCGFIDSALGMGYGVSSAAVLISLGLSPAVVSASVHTAEGFVDTVSGVSHYKLGNLEKDLFWRLVIPGVLGAVLGALFISWMSLQFAKPFVSGVLLLMGVIIFFRFMRRRIVIQRKIPTSLVPFLGFVAAFIDVSGGGGWGPLVTPVFILGGSEPRKVVGTVEITEPFISFTAMIVFGFTLGFESFLWPIVIPVMLGGFILTPIAALVTRRIPKRLLGVLVGLLLIILNGKTFLETIFR